MSKCTILDTEGRVLGRCPSSLVRGPMVEFASCAGPFASSRAVVSFGTVVWWNFEAIQARAVVLAGYCPPPGHTLSIRSSPGLWSEVCVVEPVDLRVPSWWSVDRRCWDKHRPLMIYTGTVFGVDHGDPQDITSAVRLDNRGRMVSARTLIPGAFEIGERIACVVHEGGTPEYARRLTDIPFPGNLT